MTQEEQGKKEFDLYKIFPWEKPLNRDDRLIPSKSYSVAWNWLKEEVDGEPIFIRKLKA